MVYVVVLNADELQAIDRKLDIEQRFTKALPLTVRAQEGSPQLTLVCSRSSNTNGQELAAKPDAAVHTLAWVGMVMRPQGNTVGAVDKTITIDPLRRCRAYVPLDGPNGLLLHLPYDHRRDLQQALVRGTVTVLSTATREALVDALGRQDEYLHELLRWLLAMAEPSPLNGNQLEDRFWQEEQDALGTLFRVADFSLSAIAAWQRPADRDAPYLAGLIPEPVESAFIEHDARTTGIPEAAYDRASWEAQGLRFDIHEFRDERGRVLEVANVNATPVESRLGTDMIYYHVPTKSFTLVQYKRLSTDSRELHVDNRLLSQMDRLEAVAQLSREPRTPADWRLCNDPCFLKLAYWPRDRPNDPRQPANGMYLPVSYARMLLADECTLGPRNGRVFSYDRIARYLITSQFAPLIQHGLAGTIGTTIDQLNALIRQRAREGHSVTAGIEFALESPRERQSRHRSRGSRMTRLSSNVPPPKRPLSNS